MRDEVSVQRNLDGIGFLAEMTLERTGVGVPTHVPAKNLTCAEASVAFRADVAALFHS